MADEDKFSPDKYEKAKDESWLEQHPGRPTARHDRLLRLPVKWLLTLPGLRGEDKVLTFDMPKIQGMSKIVGDKKWQRANPVTLGVQHNGKVYVDDGNHRIRAAKVAGVDSLLCRVKYYGGGEDNFDITDVISKEAALDQLVNHVMQVTNSGIDWGKVFEQAVVNKPILDGAVNQLKTKIPKVPVAPKTEVALSLAVDVLKQFTAGYQYGKTQKCRGKDCGKPALKGLFCDPCRAKPDLQVKPADDPARSQSMWVDDKTQRDIWKRKADSQGFSGATDLDGAPGDSEYNEMATRGADYAGEHDPDKGEQRIVNKNDNPADPIDPLDQKVATGSIEPVGPTPQQVEKVLKTNPMSKVVQPMNIDNQDPNKGKNFDRSAALSEPTHENLGEASLDNDGYDEAKHHLETNLGSNCKDANCKFHINAALKLAKQVLASSNKQCLTCGMPSDKCACNDGTDMSAGYTQSGTQRKNQAPKVKSTLPPGMDPSVGKHKM